MTDLKCDRKIRLNYQKRLLLPQISSAIQWIHSSTQEFARERGIIPSAIRMVQNKKKSRLALGDPVTVLKKLFT